MRHAHRLQRLERALPPAANDPGASSRQASVCEQVVSVDRSRIATVFAIVAQAELPIDADRDPAWQDALSSLILQLS